MNRSKLPSSRKIPNWSDFNMGWSKDLNQELTKLYSSSKQLMKEFFLVWIWLKVQNGSQKWSDLWKPSILQLSRLPCVSLSYNYTPQLNKILCSKVWNCLHCWLDFDFFNCFPRRFNFLFQKSLANVKILHYSSSISREECNQGRVRRKNLFFLLGGYN